ncbi:hypothetical protein B0G69_6617 [Paraburkholderia sp. RAU2J]|uniref:hypothetical protein n=1 Tax=Paraburkholderia sp. RAU2J TaxID=1938810 RepID=UPI000EAC0A38|nr:hypothetical protein [Paraburkholderia sp. RAU2J]RKT13463.1 hypothetical protein B0G69_6617 [Paraburkholderia sp. RAU2J]
MERETIFNVSGQIKRRPDRSRGVFFAKRLALRRARWPHRTRGKRRRDGVPARKWKASEVRHEHMQCSKRRYAVFYWFEQIAAWVGEIRPIEQHKTWCEFTLTKINPAIVFSVNARSIIVSVHQGGKCWDLLVDVDCNPQKAPGGWYNTLALPERPVIYRNIDTLWQCEVFNSFHKWMREYFWPSDTAILYGMPDLEGATWAKLASHSTPVGLFEIERFPIRVSYPAWMEEGSLDHAGWEG